MKTLSMVTLMMVALMGLTLSGTAFAAGNIPWTFDDFDSNGNVIEQPAGTQVQADSYDVIKAGELGW